ncbi:hypothetical protein Dimus_030947 [Dionaea muscipula]
MLAAKEVSLLRCHLGQVELVIMLKGCLDFSDVLLFMVTVDGQFFHGSYFKGGCSITPSIQTMQPLEGSCWT